MERCDVRYLNLLSVMEKEGYGMCDSIYYVKEEGEGLQGLDLIDSQLKVDEMIRKYESSKKLVLIVMRDKRKHDVVVSPMKSQRRVKFIVKGYPSYIDFFLRWGQWGRPPLRHFSFYRWRNIYKRGTKSLK